VRVANRSALHFVYYSTTKKAAFHLRKCVQRASFESFDEQFAVDRTASDGSNGRCNRKTRCKTQSCTKLLWNRHFLAANGVFVLSIHRARGVHGRSLKPPNGEFADRVHHGEKILHRWR
jgi:hypothetical protein